MTQSNFRPTAPVILQSNSTRLNSPKFITHSAGEEVMMPMGIPAATKKTVIQKAKPVSQTSDIEPVMLPVFLTDKTVKS